MPEFPLEVSVVDFRLSQIKGWKIPDDSHVGFVALEINLGKITYKFSLVMVTTSQNVVSVHTVGTKKSRTTSTVYRRNDQHVEHDTSKVLWKFLPGSWPSTRYVSFKSGVFFEPVPILVNNSCIFFAHLNSL